MKEFFLRRVVFLFFHPVVMDGYDVEAGTVHGGRSYNPGTGEVSGNTVTITDSWVAGDVFGGRGNTVVSDNHVAMNDRAQVDGSVYGGRNYDGINAVSGNSVTMNGGTVNGLEIVGGSGTDASVVSANTVTINAGTIDAGVYGGRGYDSAEVLGNSVVINGGTIDARNDLVGGSAVDGKAAGNSILVNVATLDQADPNFVAGGRGTGAGEVSENSAVLQAGTVSTVYGGYSTGSGEALKNRVGIMGGTVNWQVYGGSSDGLAADNVVEMSGGTVRGRGVIVGGFGETGAVNNTVTIMGDAVIEADGVGVQLWGGRGSSGDVFSGNTLNLMTQASVSQMMGFEFLNFHVPAAVAEVGGALLTVNGIADLTDGAGRSSVVNVGIDGNSSALKAGDSSPRCPPAPCATTPAPMWMRTASRF